MDFAIFLEIYSSVSQEDDVVECPLETLQSLCVYKYCQLSTDCLKLVLTEVDPALPRVKVKLTKGAFTILKQHELSWQVASCKLPVITSENTVVTGLCAVARHLCKCRTQNDANDYEHPKGILGFRSGCLQAPNEVSVWTKFCEIELIATTQQLINSLSNEKNADTIMLPVDVARFEGHLGKPVRIHNVYKLARDLANINLQEKKEIEQALSSKALKSKTCREEVKQRNWKSNKTPVIIESSTPIEDLNLDHEFAEGPFLTLADVFLYPLYSLIFSIYKMEILEEHIPRTIKWFKKLKSVSAFKEINDLLNFTLMEYSALNSEHNTNVTYTLPEVKDVSLYKSDPKRSNPKKRLFTKEEDVDNALKMIEKGLEIPISKNKYHDRLKVDWSSVPADAGPFGGHLPDVRMERKAQQLENLAVAVMELAKEGDRIVDFCSGSGHLGILLAHLLPKCTIILLENKEQSLQRAQSRVKSLGYKNVYFFQCNLDFFHGKFEIGTALHACGIATDLVLDNCIQANASFVICPCCYGFLHSTSRLKYPRSLAFANVPVEQYMCIGHAADQTHAKHRLEQRGARCMAVIDSDRAYLAISRGYLVFLTQLDPLHCTPKNMVIVGVSCQTK